MGITASSLKAIIYARESGVDFEQTLTIGRQACYMQQKEIDDVLSSYDPSFAPEKVASLWIKLDESKQTETGEAYFEPLLAYLGAETVDSLDYSDYEKATIIQDMNIPIPSRLKGRFSFVLDGGALEHIFNFPIAVKNCMDMVRLHGHLMLITPANNYFGHGFYQFSPELFYSLLNEANGYAETKIFMQDDNLKWYEVSSPKSLRRRVDICCAKNTPALMNVISRKVGEVPDELIVQQSDYVDTWNLDEQAGNQQGLAEQTLFSPSGLYRKIPQGLRSVITPFLRRLLGVDSRVYQAKMREFYMPCSDFDRLRKNKARVKK